MVKKYFKRRLRFRKRNSRYNERKLFVNNNFSKVINFMGKTVKRDIELGLVVSAYSDGIATIYSFDTTAATPYALILDPSFAGSSVNGNSEFALVSSSYQYCKLNSISVTYVPFRTNTYAATPATYILSLTPLYVDILGMTNMSISTPLNRGHFVSGVAESDTSFEIMPNSNERKQTKTWLLPDQVYGGSFGTDATYPIGKKTWIPTSDLLKAQNFYQIMVALGSKSNPTLNLTSAGAVANVGQLIVTCHFTFGKPIRNTA